MIVPRKYAIVSGIGYGKTKLNAFDNALCDAGIWNYNLVKISSILPPFSVQADIIDVPSGGILFSAYSSIVSKTKGETISACISVGIPTEDNVGVIMENSDRNITANALRIKTEQMVLDAMQNRNIEIDTIKSISLDTLAGDLFTCVFAGIVLWE